MTTNATFMAKPQQISSSKSQITVKAFCKRFADLKQTILHRSAQSSTINEDKLATSPNIRNIYNDDFDLSVTPPNVLAKVLRSDKGSISSYPCLVSSSQSSAASPTQSPLGGTVLVPLLLVKSPANGFQLPKIPTIRLNDIEPSTDKPTLEPTKPLDIKSPKIQSPHPRRLSPSIPSLLEEPQTSAPQPRPRNLDRTPQKNRDRSTTVHETIGSLFLHPSVSSVVALLPSRSNLTGISSAATCSKLSQLSKSQSELDVEEFFESYARQVEVLEHESRN